MDKLFHPTLHWAFDYLSMPGFLVIWHRQAPQHLRIQCWRQPPMGLALKSLPWGARIIPPEQGQYRCCWYHDDVIKYKYFPRYWPFMRGIHRSPVNSLHKGQWRGALMFSLICAWISRWENYGKAGDLRRHRSQYDVIVMIMALVVAMPSAATMLTMWNGNYPASLESESRQLETFRCGKIINKKSMFLFPLNIFRPG